MHRNRCNVSDGLHIPDLTEQFFLGIYMIRVLCKEGQQVEFLRCKVLLLPVDPDSSGSLINLNSTNLYDIILLHIGIHQTFITGQMSFYSGYQFTWTEWLCHIVIRTHAKATNLINIILLGRYHEDRNILFFPDLFTDLKSVHARKHQIQNHQIVFLSKDSFQSRLSIFLCLNLKTAEFQIVFLQFCNTFFIFYN